MGAQRLRAQSGLLDGPPSPHMRSGEAPLESLGGVDQQGRPLTRCVAIEHPLTIYLNATEVYTTMTMCGNQDLLAIGHLLNRRLLTEDHAIASIECNTDFQTVIVKTTGPRTMESKSLRRLNASGKGLGDLYYDALGLLDSVHLDTTATVQASMLLGLDAKTRAMAAVHAKTGTVHSCVLFETGAPLVCMEDVERHNAMDKVSGYMFVHGIEPGGKLLYTTGRLTSEMVLKTVLMGIPVLVSASGFTGWAVELARHADLTLIGYAHDAGFQVLSSPYRVVFDLPAEAALPARKRQNRRLRPARPEKD
jgi:FdhD protein